MIRLIIMLFLSVNFSIRAEEIKSGYKDQHGNYVFFTDHNMPFIGNLTTAESCHKCEVGNWGPFSGEPEPFPKFLILRPNNDTTLTDKGFMSNMRPTLKKGIVNTYVYKCPKGDVEYTRLTSEELSSVNAKLKEKSLTFKKLPYPKVREASLFKFPTKKGESDKYFLADKISLQTDDGDRRIFIITNGEAEQLEVKKSKYYSISMDITATDKKGKIYQIDYSFRETTKINGEEMEEMPLYECPPPLRAIV